MSPAVVRMDLPPLSGLLTLPFEAAPEAAVVQVVVGGRPVREGLGPGSDLVAGTDLAKDLDMAFVTIPCDRPDS